jgi:hypothetical protein
VLDRHVRILYEFMFFIYCDWIDYVELLNCFS